MRAALNALLAVLEDGDVPAELRVRCALHLLRPLLDEATEPSESRAKSAAERQAERRRRLAAERDLASREPSRDASRENVTSRDGRDARDVGGKGGSLSKTQEKETLSGSFSDPERESDPSRNLSRSAVTRHVTRHVTAVTSVTGVTAVTPEAEVAPPGSATTLVALDTPISREWRALAELQGVKDVTGAWAKFCGYFNGQHIDVAGRWQAWCVRERKAEQRQTHRDFRPRDGRAAVSEYEGNPNPVSPKFELLPHDEARIAAARRDQEQRQRADTARARGDSEPKKVGRRP